jgi:hypothetical protein
MSAVGSASTGRLLHGTPVLVTGDGEHAGPPRAPLKTPFSTFPRRREPLFCGAFWMPACAGMTGRVGVARAVLPSFPRQRESLLRGVPWIPAYAGMTGRVGVARAFLPSFPRKRESLLYGVPWIPACAGMTGRVGVARAFLSSFPRKRESLVRGAPWIPACAGMTGFLASLARFCRHSRVSGNPCFAGCSGYPRARV